MLSRRLSMLLSVWVILSSASERFCRAVQFRRRPGILSQLNEGKLRRRAVPCGFLGLLLVLKRVIADHIRLGRRYQAHLRFLISKQIDLTVVERIRRLFQHVVRLDLQTQLPRHARGSIRIQIRHVRIEIPCQL